MDDPPRLPQKNVMAVKLMADDYYNSNLWAQAFLYNAVKYGEPVDPDRLDQNDRSMMFMVLARFDSFKKKYAIHEFNDKEILYATSMMLTANSNERFKAIQDAQDYIQDAQMRNPHRHQNHP